MSQTYHINIQTGEVPGVSPLDAEFGRVTVILGANGTGKSRLIRKLRDLKDCFGDERPLVYIEGGRVVQVPQSVRLTSKNINQFRPADALHVATALVKEATAWVSNDQKLKRVAPELDVILLDEFVR